MTPLQAKSWYNRKVRGLLEVFHQIIHLLESLQEFMYIIFCRRDRIVSAVVDRRAACSRHLWEVPAVWSKSFVRLAAEYGYEYNSAEIRRYCHH